MKSRSVLPSIGLLIVSVTMLACAEQEIATAPAAKPTPIRPSSEMGALASFSGFLDPEGGSTLDLPAYAYADYPEGIKVIFTVSGKIHVWSAPNSGYFGSTVDAGPGGVWIDGVYQFCSVGVYIKFGGTAYGPPPCFPYDTSGEWSVTAVVSGTGKATRNPRIPSYSPGDCDTIVCHTYTGQQTITVVPMAGDLDLQARYLIENRTVRKTLFIHPFTNSDTYAHQMVYFTDSTTPRGLPVKVLFNTWTMMDPSAPPGYWQHTQPSCNMSNPLSELCVIDVRETGIFRTTARVNGVEHSDDITVYCAESEPLLNNDLVRQQMMAALDSSNGLAENQLIRKERQFLIVQDTVTPGAAPYLMILPESSNADMCKAGAVMPTPQLVPPNTRILTWGHDHPFEASADSAHTWGVCLNDQGHIDLTKTGRMQEGASGDDWTATDLFNDPSANPTAYQAGWLPMPSFIIDYHNVYVLRPGQKQGDDVKPGNKFSWDGMYPTPNDTRLPRRCGWPKRIAQ